MASDLNRWQGTGNLGADAELRYTASGAAVCNFRIASTTEWQDSDGQKQSHTEWTSCTLWNKRAEALAPHLTKGTRLFVEGEKRTRSYESDGEKKYAVDIHVSNIIFAGGKPAASSESGAAKLAHRASPGKAAGAKSKSARLTQGQKFDSVLDEDPYAEQA